MTGPVVLVVGGGAREHALAEALSRSPGVEHVLIAPGNALCERPARSDGVNSRARITRVPEASLDPEALLALAVRYDADLTVIGPEGPLAAGVVDRFEAAGRCVFGPTRAAAELESSKAFAKGFMARHRIPTARGAAFSRYDEALQYIAHQPAPLVIKASGLAGGKGAFVCADRERAAEVLWRLMEAGELGPAGREVVIEEALSGPEVSVFAITDGQALLVLPPVRDHKRLREGDSGPNTGGMGAYTPVPDVDSALLDHIREVILAPAVAGLAAEGRPYRGVLYAGLILTAAGPRCLEFNVRFGDPEAQCLLPLVEGDLYSLFRSAALGALEPQAVIVASDACAAVVVAAPGYPLEALPGAPVAGLDAARAHAEVFGAGIERLSFGLAATGGRVLSLVARAAELATALARCYRAAEQVELEGKQVRGDIGRDVRERPRSYKEAGVDIDAGARAVEGMRAAVEATFTPHVASRLGHFAGVFSARAFAHLDDPLLVASTDGVGTKSIVARQLGRWDTLGWDLLAHCINDIAVMGARPLFMLDHVASARLEPAAVAALVGGLAAACRAYGVALIGGETAEMPEVYRDGEVELTGTLIGVVDRADLIDGQHIEVGHEVLALPSTGLHTNGYTLARKALAGLSLDLVPFGLSAPLGDALLAPHRCYLPELDALRRHGLRPSGLVHITGGGLVDNPPRILPAHLALRLALSGWQVPPLFELIATRAAVPPSELRRVFNLGVGMLVVLPPAQVAAARELLPELRPLGQVVPRTAAPVVFT